MTLDPASMAAWLVAGAFAGLLARPALGGGGPGPLGDLADGLIGALVGGFLAGLLLPGVGLAGSGPAALVGAVVLVGAVRATSGGPRMAEPPQLPDEPRRVDVPPR